MRKPLLDRNYVPIKQNRFYTDGSNVFYVEGLEPPTIRSSRGLFAHPLSYPAVSGLLGNSQPLSDEEVREYAEKLKHAAELVKSRLKESQLPKKT